MSMSVPKERLMKIILAPHVSEKSTRVGEKHSQYVFKVVRDASKPEVKQAIEHLFGVKVEHVQISNVKTKPKRTGQIMGRSKAWKKAYVQLQEGQQIDFVGGQA